MPHPMSDVVVLLPGILGSVLQKDRRDLWALNAGSVFRMVIGQAALDSLTLGDDSPDVDDLGDGITAPRLFPDAHLIPGLWKIDGYSKIQKWLLRTFDLQSERTFGIDNPLAPRTIPGFSPVSIETQDCRTARAPASGCQWSERKRAA